MKKILLGFFVLNAVISLGYCQEQTQPLKLAIKSDKQVYEVGEDIKITAYFENQSNDIITAAIGRKRFSDLDIYKDSEKLQMGILYDIKEVPLGFLQSDYQHIKPNEIKEVTMLSKIEKFVGRKLMGPSIDYTGFGIVSENVVFLFKTPGSFQLRLKYQPKFPSSKSEAIHSAYHKMENVWQGTLTSNTITIEVKEKRGITKEEALKIAERIYEKSGWEKLWSSVRITEEKWEDKDVWAVRVNEPPRTTNGPVVLIDKHTGTVLHSKYYNK